MARLETTRRGWGAVDHPETGELIQLGDEIDLDVAKRVAAQYSKIYVVEDESAVEDKDEEYTCGVNDCSRTVDSPDATCWQH